MLDWEAFLVPTFTWSKSGSGGSPSNHEMGVAPNATMSD